MVGIVGDKRDPEWKIDIIRALKALQDHLKPFTMNGALYHLKHVIHPHIMRTILYDHHVEDRMDMLVHYERIFQENYGTELFIQCDIDDWIISYHVDELNIKLEMSWNAGDEDKTADRDNGEGGEGGED